MQLKGYTTGGFERGVPAWKEALWLLVRGVFFESWVPWPSVIRVGWLRAFGAEVGERVVVRSQVKISFPWRLKLGDDVWLGEEVMILSLANVTIGSDVCISQRAFLCTGSHAFESRGFDLIVRPIVIGSGSWIAAQAFVAAGVEIGAGSLVGAGSIVLRDVPPGVLVQGNPAAVVKTWTPPG